LHSLKQHPVYLHNQSEFKFSYYIVFKMSSSFIHIHSVVHNALQQAIPCVNQASSQISHVLNGRLISTHDPASCPNILDSQHSTKTRTIHRTEVRRNECWNFTLKELDHLTCTMCWRTVLSNTTINVSKGSVAAVCRWGG